MAEMTTEMTWMRYMLSTLEVKISQPMRMNCNNKATTYIVNSLVFCEHTKHIEADCHYIRNPVHDGSISIIHVFSEDRSVDLFTEPYQIPIENFTQRCNMLSMIDVHTPV